MDSFARFEERQLPPPSAFYSSLTMEEISDEDYAHAHKVWDAFGLKNLGQYHDLYVTSDVVLLADIFENFRRLSLDYYRLDPCHFFTSPGLAWQSSLRMTGVKLELLQDPDKILFLERGIRGGVAMISQRYARANNKYLPDYDVSKPSSYIMYLDANNLYGWAMSQPLPTHGFEWEKSSVNFMDVADDADVGYILEVDLDYPAHLHDLHTDYPLAAESLVVQPEMLSPYQQQLSSQLNIKPVKCQKLVPNLMSKSRYVVHYRNLKQYVSLGMVVTKVHRILKFHQSPWLAKYINFNTERRKMARSEFEKDLFKLLNNAVFGKTMENLRNRVNIELVHQEKRAKKLVASPTFHSFNIISDNLVSIERRKMTLTLNRPIYVGFCILDLSKSLMYDFHYNYVKSNYSEAHLLLTDTDSLLYFIKTDDIYVDMGRHLHLFDTSDYPQNHLLHSQTNKKILGKFKDETKGQPISEFIGLKPKMYSILCGVESKKRAKGVAKAICEKNLKHESYKTCLFNEKRTLEAGQRFKSTCHAVQTVSYNKIALCPYDTKRYILDDGVRTLAHGHYSIVQNL